MLKNVFSKIERVYLKMYGKHSLYFIPCSAIILVSSRHKVDEMGTTMLDETGRY
jgi:hypothetical protein